MNIILAIIAVITMAIFSCFVFLLKTLIRNTKSDKSKSKSKRTGHPKELEELFPCEDQGFCLVDLRFGNEEMKREARQFWLWSRMSPVFEEGVQI